MEEHIVIDDYYRLWILLSQTRAAIMKARHKRVGSYIPHNQAASLLIVWALNGRATPAILSHHLFLERHTVSELLTRLVKKGFIKKNKDSKNNKAVRIAITEKGREVCLRGMGMNFIGSIMSSLSGEQRKQLQSCLCILYGEAVKKLEVKGEIPLSFML